MTQSPINKEVCTHLYIPFEKCQKRKYEFKAKCDVQLRGLEPGCDELQTKLAVKCNNQTFDLQCFRLEADIDNQCMTYYVSTHRPCVDLYYLIRKDCNIPWMQYYSRGCQRWPFRR